MIRSSHVYRGIFFVALAIMLFHFFVYAVYAFELMRFPFDYDQGEGFELLDAVYLSEGRLPYQDSDVYPYYASNYPPVYRMVLAPFVWVFGAEYWYGRLVSFLGTLVTAGLIAYGVYRGEKRPGIAGLMGLVYLASNYIYHIGPLLRQHFFMVIFETLALVLLANVFELPAQKQRSRLLLGLGVLVIAGYTKQLAVFTCAAVFIWLFIRNPRRALVYAIGFGVVVGVIFGVLNLLTQGQWWVNAVGANVNEFYISQFFGLFSQFFRLHWAILLLAALLVVYELYFSRLSIYAVWWVITLASTVGSGSWGAGDSYFATTWAASCILAGIFISRSLNEAWHFPDNYLSRFLPVFNPRLLSMGSLLLVVVFGLTVVKIPTSGAIFEPLSQFLGVSPNPGHRYPLYDAAGWTPGYATIGHFPSAEDRENGWRIVARIQEVDAPIISEEAGFMMQAGREVVTNPTQLKNLYANDLLDPSQLIEQIENQDFGLIIFRARFYPEPVLAAIDDAYAPREVIPMNGFDYELWYPESTWETRRQIRNYLEGQASTDLTLELPPELSDPEQWLLEMMGRWAWLPELSAETTASECLTRHFIRREQRAILVICDQTLSLSPPNNLVEIEN